MKIKYTYTLYNKRNPYGIEKTAIANGKLCEKPSYIGGCNTGWIFIKTKKNIIHCIQTEKIIKIERN